MSKRILTYRTVFTSLLTTIPKISQRQFPKYQGVLHRDLKLENILLGPDKLQLVITDFGLSNTWSLGKSLDTYCGSAEYAAPELFAKQNYGPEVRYGAKCSVIESLVRLSAYTKKCCTWFIQLPFL